MINRKKNKKELGIIFIGNIKEISPNVFTDDENIYYFHAYDVWHRRKGGRGSLASRNTEIYYLDKKDDWEKIVDIESGIYGTVWKKGNRYYYFDNLGINQLIDNAIYEIKDKETLQYLLNNSRSTTKIKELIENEKLIKVEGEKKVKIVVKYEDERDFFWKIFIVAIFLVGTGSTIIKIIKGVRNESK